MMTNRSTKTLCVCIFFVAVLIACTAQNTEQHNLITPSLPEEDDIKATETHTPNSSPLVIQVDGELSATQIPAPTVEASSTITTTLTPLAEATPTGTHSPFPTLSQAERDDFFATILTGNLQCSLPCWWDAVPGVTLWSSIEPFIQSLDARIIRHGTATMPPPLVGYEVYVDLLELEDSVQQIGIFYTVNNGLIENIELQLGNLNGYSLFQILSMYSKPAEIQISTLSEPREGDLPFRLQLYYPDNGFVVEYYSNATMNGQNVIGCFREDSQNDHPYVFIWDPEISIPFSLAVEMAGTLDEGQTYLTVERATNLSIDEFYTFFLEPSNEPCIETSSELWLNN